MSPDLFQALFEASPNPYMVLDRELRYVAANPAYLRVTASRWEELIGRKIFDLFPHDPQDPANAPRQMLLASFERVLATGKQDVLSLIPYRVPMHTPQGVVMKERFWSATHTPLPGPDGEVAYILQHTNDVSELQALKQAVREVGSNPQLVEANVFFRANQVQEENRTLGTELSYLHRMFAQAPGFICFLRGPKHVFTLANDAYLQLVGAGRSLIGQEVRSALPEIEGQGFFELLDQVFASREPAFGHAAKVALRRTVDGSLEDRFVDFIYQPIVDAEGNVLGIFCQGNDVTERKQLEDERTRLLEAEQQARMDAEAANRLKDEFLATVSHELRTPLTAVLGWVQMLRSGRLPETSRARALETVERNARAQAKLIDDLLDVSRILSGKLNLELSVVSLAGPVEAALEAVRPAAEAKGVQLEASLDAELHVNGDPTRIQQMAWNLLANAVKFTPAGGRVTVALEDQGDAVELTVKDTGQGIAQAFLPHLFERFRQADARPSREHGGLGLGLSIVKHLVEAHGGTVSAESGGEGAGSTFRLRLPLAVRRADLGLTLASAALAGDASELTWPPSLKGLNVLVVDDEQDTRELLRELLEQVGMSVKTAASAGEGLELLTGTRPDILVADLAMPGEDGFSLIRQVRDLAPDLGGRTPAVALTAYARPEDRARVLLSGFKAHVPKPIEPKEFLAVLASLL